jgi:hypothetical protein
VAFQTMLSWKTSCCLVGGGWQPEGGRYRTVTCEDNTNTLFRLEQQRSGISLATRAADSAIIGKLLGTSNRLLMQPLRQR